MKTKLFIIILLLTFGAETGATIRYVSKTGTNIEPCTTWTTASTTIMGAYSLCSANDTIFVAEGAYREYLFFNQKGITLIGLNPLTTIIDNTGLDTMGVRIKESTTISGFTILGRTNNYEACAIYANPYRATTDTILRIDNCIITKVSTGIVLIDAQAFITNCSFIEISNALLYLFNHSGDETTVFNNNFVSSIKYNYVNNPASVTAAEIYGGSLIFRNNILRTVVIPSTVNAMIQGIFTRPNFRGGEISNNIFIGYQMAGISISWTYTNNPGNLYVFNNIVSYQPLPGEVKGAIINANRKNSHYHNNMLTDNVTAVRSDSTKSLSYNAFFRNQTDIRGTAQTQVGNLFVDPMVTNDSTAVTAFDQLDYHLQKYSPLIDAGDPSVTDRDGTRSDIGLYGGPFGAAYQYLDLPPRKPRGIHSFYQEGIVYLKWGKNTEADFKEYRLYRDTVAQFTPSAATLLSAQGDTLYSDSLTMPANGFYYRIAAVDSQGNVSDYSHQVSVVFVGVDEPKVSEEISYSLEQNYPNPFNPKTTIRFTVKERCRVMVTIYDMEGAEVYNSGDRYYGRGENEMEIDMTGFSSGIYLYRINAVNEENIPVFRDVKKMILLK